MKKAYKTLTDYEYDVLCKVMHKTGLDCWCCIRQDDHGVDYVYDMEERKRLCLRTGVGLVSEAIDCQVIFDNCLLEYAEREALRSLFEKLNVALNVAVDWRL